MMPIFSVADTGVGGAIAGLSSGQAQQKNATTPSYTWNLTTTTDRRYLPLMELHGTLDSTLPYWDESAGLAQQLGAPNGMSTREELLANWIR